MNRILRLVSFLLVIANMAWAQGNNTGEIYGRVIDENGKPLEFASVQAMQGDITKGGKKTDLEGNYSIKPLSPGKFNLKVTFAGYTTQVIEGVVVPTDGRVKVDVKMEKTVKAIGGKDGVKIVAYKRPLISTNGPVRGMDKEAMKEAPSISTGDFASMQAGAYQSKAGQSAVSLGGDRSTGTQYLIDGILVRGSRAVNIPVGGIENLEVISNGLPAKYGNGTGGIISITTSSIAPKVAGGIQYQRSVEGYNNNLLAVNLSGPLLSTKRNGNTKPVLGFLLNLQAKYDKDNNPFYYKYYRIKADKLKEIQENPLIPNPDGSLSFVRTGEMVTASDFEKIKARENGQTFQIDYVGKVDYQPSDNINFTVGVQGNYTKGRGYSFANSLFAPEANSISSAFTGRGYARLTHRLGKSGMSEKKDEKYNPISNAYYTLQFTYQKEYTDAMNPDHGRDIFKYGYLGKFIMNQTPRYTFDTALNANFLGIKYLGLGTDSITFIPNGSNPLLENYTKAIFNNSDRFPVNQINDIQAYQGLRNGDGPQSVYGMWTGPGSQIGSYSYSESDQATLNLDASFSIEQGGKKGVRKDKLTHNIEFGLGYDQRTSRSYAVANVWSIMRLLANKHIANLDLANPHFIVGGVDQTQAVLNGTVNFSPFDSIKYDPLYVASEQSRFDKELRKKLNLPGGETNTTYINVDGLDPSTFNLNMFSATELFNNGNDRVSYFGYDYLGNKVKKQPSFKDFWTKKDARGEFSRPIGAFRPIYMFGYILDKFNYKDISFNIGLRVDRYDANQKVLKDPYSLYAVRKVKDIQEGTYNVAYNAAEDKYAPGVKSFDNDYVAYVNSNKTSRPTVVGYRKGDVWYDPYGKEIADPTILSGLYADGLPIQPWLQNSTDSIKSSNFNPDNSFEDYKPQVTLSPRIKFSFPISDNALFYGNYDVITQTPSSNNFTTPDDYYYMAERNTTINNANLKMERAINYSFGYQQKLTNYAALTLEGYYRERKNQIQIQRYLLAYPITYSSYGNRDYSTTKGLTVKLDFRRKGPIRMDINYTLQFAEGTGSNSTSQSSLLATGQPNLRTVFPLDFDSRHMLNATIDYRYSDDNTTLSKEARKGPKIGNMYPFRNAGINLQFRTRSGEPYTRAALATPINGGDFNSTPIVGTVNGSRLPWNFELSTRIDKDITLKLAKDKKDMDGKVVKSREPLYINVYCYITNLLNTRNQLGVYGYTGVAKDDGYLSSPQGQQALNTYQFSQSFADLYSYRLLNPGSFNSPRMIFFGFSLDF